MSAAEDMDWERARRKQYDKEYYQENRDRILKQHRERRDRNILYAKKYQEKLKFTVLTEYSEGDYPKCVICGEERMGCLSIDHINNDGAEHRREIGYSSGGQLYRWLKRNNFPSGFQTLCMNCQWVKNKENDKIGRTRRALV